MEDLNKQKNWAESIFIVIIIFLNIVSFASNFIRAIISSISGSGSLTEYLFLLFYILPVLIIISLLKRIPLAFLITGVWCLISAIYLFCTVLFSSLEGSLWLLLCQFILIIVLSIASFYLWNKIKKEKNV